jgi:hypothetical protein
MPVQVIESQDQQQQQPAKALARDQPVGQKPKDTSKEAHFIL